MIQPNCRMQFTAADIDFILSALDSKTDQRECLVQLLADEETRDLILDDELLHRALLERHGYISVSSHLYFYVLVRQVLKRAGVLDRSVADYVAEILAEFSRTERTRCVVPGEQVPMDYFFEMLAALQRADERTSFFIRAHIGNHSLFFSGVFYDRVRYRNETRGFPDVDYYEQLGRSSFRMASDHRLAKRYDLAPIFNVLADQFRETRLALNDLSERVLTLGDNSNSLDLLLKRHGITS